MGNIRRVGRRENPVTDTLIALDVFARLQQATASQPGQLVELCREYLSEAAQTLAQLRKASTLQQADELRNRAHYLRGSSMLVGATRLTQCCANLEVMGRNGDFRETEQVLDETSAALDAVEQEFVKMLGPEVLPAKRSAV
ncbi:MAG: Hpt domain-containing protein [Candidatus Korobacteraceae bacterium]